MKIAFIMSNYACYRPMKAEELFTSQRGLTGSEMSMLMIAKCVAEEGHDVTVFGTFINPAKVDGIEYAQNSTIQLRVNEGWDAAAAWIDPAPLSAFPASVKKIFDQQVNDFNYCPGWEDYVDVITSPSYSHRNQLKKYSNFVGRWEVLPNGADSSIFSLNNKFKNNTKSMMFASSPDRGLHWILEAFPKIKKRVPEATLDVFYDWQNFYNSVRHGDSEISYRLRYCKEMFERLKPHGVTHHGSASRQRIVNAFSNTRILAFTCDTVTYTEGFSVTTLEAAMMGCVPVIVDTDALGEIYGGYVPVIKGPYKEHKEEYIETVIELLTNEQTYSEWQQKSSQLSQKYDWKIIGRQFIEIIQKD